MLTTVLEAVSNRPQAKNSPVYKPCGRKSEAAKPISRQWLYLCYNKEQECSLFLTRDKRFWRLPQDIDTVSKGEGWR